MNKSCCSIVTVICLAFIVLAMLPAAEAIPAFSRKTELSCTACHSAWPALNEFGRTYKLNGFRLDPGEGAPSNLENVDGNLWTDKHTILSARLKGYGYDKKDTDDEWKLKPGHELELYLAGNAANNFSFFAEVEAEDDAGFGIALEKIFGGWHPREEANLVVGWGSLFWTDPYNTLTEDGGRLTRSHKAPLDKRYLSGARLRDSTHQATFYGRKSGLYYSATIASGGGDTSGGDEKDVALRAAYDLPWFTLGGFYVDGSTIDEDFQLSGIDFQFEADNFVVYGLWLESEQDLTILGRAFPFDETNASAYVEAFYIVPRNDSPFFVPLLRWETYEANDGTEEYSAIAAALQFYVRPNINLVLEHWTETDVPTGQEENDRTTLMFNLLL